MITGQALDRLPGREFLFDGLQDIREGRVTVASCLVEIGAARIIRAGLLPEHFVPAIKDPEFTLYQLLPGERDVAYAQYNAWMRRLSSLEHALDHLCMDEKG